MWSGLAGAHEGAFRAVSSGRVCLQFPGLGVVDYRYFAGNPLVVTNHFASGRRQNMQRVIQFIVKPFSALYRHLKWYLAAMSTAASSWFVLYLEATS